MWLIHLDTHTDGNKPELDKHGSAVSIKFGL